LIIKIQDTSGIKLESVIKIRLFQEIIGGGHNMQVLSLESGKKVY